MRIGGWSDYKVMHEIYTHLAARDLNARVGRWRISTKKICDRTGSAFRV